MGDKLFYNPRELAERWGVGESTVNRWLNEGILRGTRLGGRLWRIPAESVASFEACPPAPKTPEKRKPDMSFFENLPEYF